MGYPYFWKHPYIYIYWYFTYKHGHCISLCPSKVANHDDPVPTQVPFLLPHEILDAVSRAGSVQWGRSMSGHRSSASIAAFWNHCKSLDEWKNHPALKDVTSLGRPMAKLRKFWALLFSIQLESKKIWFEVFLASCFIASQGMIPLCLHVDGAEFYANSEYLCWSMASIFADGHVFDCKFPLCVLPHQSMATDAVKQHVHTTVAKVLSWSLRVAATGVFPTKGAFDEPLSGPRLQEANKSIASGWKATYFGFRFDEKARKESNLFQRTYQHSLICMNCLAQKQHKGWQPALCYKNMHSSAAHRLAPISYFVDFLWWPMFGIQICFVVIMCIISSR